MVSSSQRSIIATIKLARKGTPVIFDLLLLFIVVDEIRRFTRVASFQTSSSLLVRYPNRQKTIHPPPKTSPTIRHRSHHRLLFMTKASKQLNDDVPPSSRRGRSATAPTTAKLMKTKTDDNDDTIKDIVIKKPDCTLSTTTITYCEEDNNNDVNFLKSFIQHTSIEYHYFTRKEAYEIRSALLHWYRSHRRKLPWRGDPPPWNGSTMNFIENIKNKQGATTSKKQQTNLASYFSVSERKNKSKIKGASNDDDKGNNIDKNDPFQRTYPMTPYGVWVSEIMLQQTRVDAVIPYWIQWMTQFPTVDVLAMASEDTVNAAWAGLGFYRRVRLLHAASKMVTQQYNGIVPSTVEELLKLPGIGQYTACAIASIAYNAKVAVVDGNVCRVLSRLRCIAQNVKSPIFKDTYGWTLAQKIIDATTTTTSEDDGDAVEDHCAGELNQAMMELGATYCAPSGTGIDPNDPLRHYYWSTKLGVAIANTDAGTISTWINNASTTAKTTTSQSSSTTISRNNKKANIDSCSSSCPVCSEDGIGQVIQNIQDGLAAEKLINIDTARKCGHAVFPPAPPKTAKREEVLAVAVVSCNYRTSTDSNNNAKSKKHDIHNDDDETCWLLVRRPKKGLLAGQWEFPSVCVWSSDEAVDGTTQKTKKRKDMSDQVPIVSAVVRRKAMNRLMLEIAECHDKTNKNKSSNNTQMIPISTKGMKPVGDRPIEHIFSHVRHTMWIEYCNVPVTTTPKLSWIDSMNREVRWMNESDMKAVGVTSGVQKILSTVRNNCSTKKDVASSKQPPNGIVSSSSLMEDNIKSSRTVRISRLARKQSVTEAEIQDSPSKKKSRRDVVK